VRPKRAVFPLLIFAFPWIVAWAANPQRSMLILDQSDADIFAVVIVRTQQITGSSRATTTVDGARIPLPPPGFGDVIKKRATESKPCWLPRIVIPTGSSLR
jgi:hypothetical protein